ncbi:MAG: 50S ribosomal protein L11 methyltransferase [Candidatus Aquicultorales bacterium]
MLIKLTAAVRPEAEEAVAQALFAESPGGVAIEEAGGEILVSVYIEADRVESVREEVRRSLRLTGFSPAEALITTESVDEREWETAYREHFHCVKIGRLVVKPSWELYRPSGDELVIELDPGMAFGTGAHPTTKGCLTALDRYLKPGQSVFDLGTGSGILAIAAAKLGASFALAVDTDIVAVETAEANARTNGVRDVIAVALGGVEQAGGRPFDLVVANLTAPDIVGVLSDLARIEGLKTAVFSGILEDQRSRVESALDKEGLTVIGAIAEEGWVTLVAERRR